MLLVRSIILFSVLSVLMACGGGNNSEPQNNLPVVAAGDFDTLRASVTLRAMPQTLVTQDLSGNERAYVSVTFDINNDGEVSDGDVQLNIGPSTSAQTGQEEIKISLYEYHTQYYNLLAYIEYEIIGNELTFIVQKNQSSALNTISTSTQINVAAAIRDLSTDQWSTDYLPNFRNMTQVQNVSEITDPQMDYEGIDSSIDIQKFTLELY